MYKKNKIILIVTIKQNQQANVYDISKYLKWYILQFNFSGLSCCKIKDEAV